MQAPRIASRDEWLNQRTALLAREKELTRLRDQLALERRQLPWVPIEKDYRFEGPDGSLTLGDLFAGRSQLVVKHFMLGPDWLEGCVGCSFECDHVEGALIHLENHDVSFVAVARAPLAEIQAFKERMGWRFRWVSSFGSDFNYDFNVSFTPEAMAAGTTTYNYRPGPVPIDELSGFSIFARDEQGRIHHTYSTFGRGAEEVLGTYVFLDLTPRGRNETGPRKNLTDWVRHHDRYGQGGHVAATGRFVPASANAGKAGSATCCGS